MFPSSSRLPGIFARMLSFGSVLALGGCYIDTSSMNTDRFAQQTRPIFYVDDPADESALPTTASGYVSPPNTLPRVPLQSRLLSAPGITPPATNYPAAPAPLVHTAFLTPPGAAVTTGMTGEGTYDPAYDTTYGAFFDKDRMLPAIPYKRINAKYLRQEVSFASSDKPGTIVVDTREKLLYLILGNGRAMRYGVGLGREGFAWHGRGVIQWRQRWPRWTPPDEMVQRQPEIAQYAAARGGMNPGLDNPLGARALYIFQNGQDSLYRIHGTPQWQSIGKSVSSGCVRMLNQDVIDLFDRLPDKAEIIVL
nr:L,D-transpeptidase [uncultured Gellertiella sp.]